MIRRLLKVKYFLPNYKFGVSAKEIKKLRDLTGSTINECKMAIENS